MAVGTNGCWSKLLETHVIKIRPRWASRFYVVVWCALLFFSGCNTLPEPRDAVILGVEEGKKVSETYLLDKMGRAQVIYLGEKHDNPHHHLLQRAIVEKLIAQGKRPALGFEFFSKDQTGWLMNYSQGKPSPFSAEGPDETGKKLRNALGWQDRSDWVFYFPLIQLARQYHLPVFGADLPSGLRVRLTRSGVEALSAIEKSMLVFSSYQKEDYRQFMLKRLADSHCGLASESLLLRLYSTWLLRNESMAQSIFMMLEQRPKEPVIVVLGMGHVANDGGVYERMAFLKPGVRQVNLAFQESEYPSEPFDHYFQPITVGQGRFVPEHHYFWLTPPVMGDENLDPCATLHRRTPERGGERVN